MAEKVGAVIAMPRIVSRQKDRSNAEAHSSRILQKQRTHSLSQSYHYVHRSTDIPNFYCATSLLDLVPSILYSKNPSLNAVVDMYDSDLLSPELPLMELNRWKNRYMSISPDKRPSTPAKGIKG